MAALVGSAALSTPAAQADQGLPGRIAYASDDALIQTIEGDGTRVKTAFDRVTGAEWSALKLRDPAYSPDGHKLVFTGESADATRIGVVEDGKVVTVAQSTAAIKGLQQPAFSADGKKVVFRALDADWALYTVNAAGGTPTKIALENREPARARLLAGRAPARVQRARRQRRPPRLPQEPRDRAGHASSPPAAPVRPSRRSRPTARTSPT